MQTLRDFFENDFDNTLKMPVSVPIGSSTVDGYIMYDMSACSAYLSIYLRRCDSPAEPIKRCIESLDYGQTELGFGGRVILPKPKFFVGRIEVTKSNPISVRYQFPGESLWREIERIPTSHRVYVYSESEMSSTEIDELVTLAHDHQHDLIVRSNNYLDLRNKFEIPLAFICHDSRDKESIARPIANYLQQRLYPVWFDEYSLSVGDSIRESIDAGLKSCKSCILLVTPNFLSNKGWTKREFNSVVTREMISEQNVVLPIWSNVSRDAVYDYSPSLVDTLALVWEELGETEVCKRIAKKLDEM